MSLFKRNVETGKHLRASTWRKIAIGTWNPPGDPSVYGILEFDVQPALQYMEEIRQRTGRKITLTHFVGKVIAKAYERHPDLNCLLRWGRLYPRKTIDVFFQIATDMNGKDLSGSTIKNANLKKLEEIADELQAKAKSVREHGDPAFRKMKSTMSWVPGLVMNPLLKVVSFILYTLNIWSPLLGNPQDSFGSVMVTNIGSLGLDAAFAPLVPYSRVPLVLAVGVTKETPVVRNGKIEVANLLRICATFDHRLIDGVHASHIVKTVNELFADPKKVDAPFTGASRSLEKH